MRECACPYFVHEGGDHIKCGMARLSFPSREAKRDYMSRYCSQTYRLCCLYLSQSKYRKEDEEVCTSTEAVQG